MEVEGLIFSSIIEIDRRTRYMHMLQKEVGPDEGFRIYFRLCFCINTQIMLTTIE
jgi:hypothetical protein